MNNSDLATRETAGAFYTQEHLVIWACGEKPTPSHVVTIEPIRMPNTYELRWEQVGAAIDLMTPYYVYNMFPCGACPETVTLIHQTGSDKLTVEIVLPPVPAPDLVAAAARAGGGGEDEIPSPYAYRAGGGGGGEIPTPFNKPPFIPFSMTRVLETRDSKNVNFSENVQYAEASGYSTAYSFEEAFQNAINNLPPDPHPYPDKMISVHVKSVGAQMGSIAGINRMVVTVETYF